MPPFVIFGLPRSRTAWLARFLSAGGWHCGHDELRHCRSLDDVRAWLSQPQTGTVETAAAPFWRLLARYQPDARVVVVRRPVAEVVDSLMRLGPQSDRAGLTAEMMRLDRKLDQIAARWPGALQVTFDGLREEATCARVFEHCTGLLHDPAWWAAWAPVNVQIDFAALMRYCDAYRPALEKLARQAQQQMLAAMARRPAVDPAGVTFQTERFDSSYQDATPLMREHMVQTGQDVEDYGMKNLPILRRLDEMGALQVMTARCNGKMAAYLVSVIFPSLDSTTETCAQHLPFFTSPDFPGLGAKLKRAAEGALRERGVDEVFMRAGVRGSGPRLGALFRRQGAEPFGELYRLDLRDM